MQSTNVNRTLQSGYSELMGLYPPGAGANLTQAMQSAVAAGGVSAPPLGVRDAGRINEALGEQALPFAYVQVPITEYNNHDINDDVSTDGCEYINYIGGAREHRDSIWHPRFDWMQEQTQEAIEKALDMTQD